MPSLQAKASVYTCLVAQASLMPTMKYNNLATKQSPYRVGYDTNGRAAPELLVPKPIIVGLIWVIYTTS